MPGLRALGFASHWFDPAIVARVFEPLVADWQREWQDASGAHRVWVSLRGVSAFISTIFLMTPGVLRTPTPSVVMNRVVTRIARFTLIGSVLLVMPFVLNNQPSWLGALTLLLIVPSTLAVAFPFAMITAVDAIRCDHALPKHVERAAVTKLALGAVVLMLAFLGWIVPATNQVWRAAMTPAGIQTPAPGVRELTIGELITDPSHASAGEKTNAWGRAAAIRRELNNRASLAVLPVFLLWLRWRMLDLPRRRWSPLPPTIAAIAVVTGYMLLRLSDRFVEETLSLQPGTGLWMPFVVFAAIMFLNGWRRDRVSARETRLYDSGLSNTAGAVPSAPQAP